MTQPSTLTFTDAMILGSAITDAKPHDLDHCALGMAANAIGIPTQENLAFGYQGFGGFRSRFDFIYQAWPWLRDLSKCKEIVDKFNWDVCPANGKPTMTWDEFVARVRELETEAGAKVATVDAAVADNAIAAELTK